LYHAWCPVSLVHLYYWPLMFCCERFGQRDFHDPLQLAEMEQVRSELVVVGDAPIL